MSKKVIYSAPLKALSAEKFNEWAVRFPNHKVMMLTGDTLTSTKIRAEMMEQCKTADIILMTSELLDSLTRNHQSENYQWLYDVALMICDESHIITSEGGRGACVEASTMRFSQINPKAKIWMLSATMPNVEEFSTWLTKLNSKPTHILNSSWRPTTLIWHFLQHITFGGYYEIQQDKMAKACALVQSKPNEKFLVFVWDKNTGRALLGRLKELGVECDFHNADVDFEGRTGILERFENNNDPLRVVVATTTLAWGSLHEDTLVQTVLGPYRYGSLEPGTKILSYNEQAFCWEFDEVVSRDLCEESEEIVIELEDGQQLIAGPSHPIYVQLSDGSLINKQADQLIVGDDVKMF